MVHVVRGCLRQLKRGREEKISMISLFDSDCARVKPTRTHIFPFSLLPDLCLTSRPSFLPSSFSADLVRCKPFRRQLPLRRRQTLPFEISWFFATLPSRHHTRDSKRTSGGIVARDCQCICRSPVELWSWRANIEQPTIDEFLVVSLFSQH